MHPPLTRADLQTMVLPTRRTGAGAASSGDVPAFVGHIDEPPSTRVPSRGLSVVALSGWVASTLGRDVQLTVRVDGGDPSDVPVDLPRPDVADRLGTRFGPDVRAAGFQVNVPIPSDGSRRRSIPMTVDISDGEYSTTRTFRIELTKTTVTPRSDYKSTWNSVAGDLDSAKLAVSGYTDEAEYTRTANENVELLRNTVGFGPDDEILEIGCGVGRVGAALAPLCRRWVGADVSSNMLRHAAERLREHDNVELVELNGWDLEPIASESLDVVYSTVVFMHLDEWERYRYVAEAMRVLRPGGRLYVDNFNLCSDPGWEFFMAMATNHHPLLRPPNISKSSTPEELRTYFERAGFEDIVVSSGRESLWLSAIGRKPTAAQS